MLRAAIRYVVLGVLFSLAVFIQGGEIWHFAYVLAHKQSTPTYPFWLEPATRTVTYGPFRGDQLLAINGRPV